MDERRISLITVDQRTPTPRSKTDYEDDEDDHVKVYKLDNNIFSVFDQLILGALYLQSPGDHPSIQSNPLREGDYLRQSETIWNLDRLEQPRTDKD